MRLINSSDNNPVIRIQQSIYICNACLIQKTGIVTKRYSKQSIIANKKQASWKYQATNTHDTKRAIQLTSGVYRLDFIREHRLG